MATVVFVVMAVNSFKNGRFVPREHFLLAEPTSVDLVDPRELSCTSYAGLLVVLHRQQYIPRDRVPRHPYKDCRSGMCNQYDDDELVELLLAKSTDGYARKVEVAINLPKLNHSHLAGTRRSKLLVSDLRITHAKNQTQIELKCCYSGGRVKP